MITLSRIRLLTLLVVFGCNGMHAAPAESSVNALLSAVEILSAQEMSETVQNLRQLFEYLRVQSAEEAVTYVTQMHEDMNAIISALGAANFHQALGNAKQYRSVFDQVRALKDTIQP